MSTQVEARPAGAGTDAVEMTYREAVNAAQLDAMEADDRVILMSEEIAKEDILEDFGPRRPALELRQLNPGVGERPQYPEQRSWHIRLEQKGDRGLVISGRLGFRVVSARDSFSRSMVLGWQATVLGSL